LVVIIDSILARAINGSDDLEEDMRLDTKTTHLSKIQVARLERSGDISFIKAD
jgi:uncharacterized membrane protein YcaP (DUF421 family)